MYPVTLGYTASTASCLTLSTEREEHIRSVQMKMYCHFYTYLLISLTGTNIKTTPHVRCL